jgi:TolB-like protein/Flp pilus assembly protein TadD
VSSSPVSFYEFGAFRLDIRGYRLLFGNEPAQLSPKAFITLLLLVQNRDRVVTKREILNGVWPDTYVGEGNLAQIIFVLRKALGENKDNQYIVTIPGVGYRFVAFVNEICVPEAHESAISERMRAARNIINSVAVLPLLNVSPDKELEYFSDGITESIINALTQLTKLRVVPRSTVFRFKNTQADPQEVGRELGVRAVLTGRVMLFGERLMVNVELIDVAHESQLWGEQYNRKFADIFEVQEEISKTISQKLLVKLSGEEQKRITKRHTRVAEAYRHYLRGRSYWNKRTEYFFEKGLEHFSQAIELDPTYALAYAGLADSYILLGVYGMYAPDHVMPKAKAAAVRALQLDESLGEAHISLAYISAFYEWNWKSSEAEFKKAIQLNPEYATAHHWYAFLLAVIGRLSEALLEIKLAQQLEPQTLIITADVGLTYYLWRQYDKAIEECEKTLNIDAAFSEAHMLLGVSYAQQGRFKPAISELSEAVTLSGGNLLMKALLGYALAESGEKDEARKIVDELIAAAPERYSAPYNFALVYAGLGEIDNTLAKLQEAYQHHDICLTMINVDPIFDGVRSDPRFVKLIAAIGLEP